MSSRDVQLSQQSLSSLQPQQRGQERKQRAIKYWRYGLRWTVRLGHCQRKGGRRTGGRGRETAPFVRAGDAPSNSTPFMHAPACPRQRGVSQSRTGPDPSSWRVRKSASKRGEEIDRNRDWRARANGDDCLGKRSLSQTAGRSRRLSERLTHIFTIS